MYRYANWETLLRGATPGELGMVRFLLAGFVMLALAGEAAAEQDNGPALVNFFADTCALRPALPSALERIASGLGFVSAGGPITAEMEAGPSIDIVYSAELKMWGEKIAGLMAYFEGPVDSPTVSCEVSGVGVSAEALPGLIEKSFNGHDRTEEAPDENPRRATWRVGAAVDGDTLEMWAGRDSPRRASITIQYIGRKQ